ncbi:MAG: ATP-binding cassette, subfamily bacterial IrtB/YbtQ [Clostridiales bacterium]|jgi:ATP-binding cassette subfamily B protein|nr:ATP-binding cassette, subfamily bacterial IrtB/YbtQ [Clostridiales bacterium]
MMQRIQRQFALTPQGARDLVKATLLTAAANLSLMLPVGLLVVVLEQLLAALNAGTDPAAGAWGVTVIELVLVGIIFALHWYQYKSLYIATYDESANRRVGLAETLRRLPLSFFGNRDLTDLTKTMMSDCNSLEQAFSHYIPQLFGAVLSTTLVAVGLFSMNWRLAIAALWVVPVSLLLAVGSKKLQDVMGTKNILAKRVAADGIQECIETAREIKACNQKEHYMQELHKKLDAVEKAAIRSELTTGTFISGAQMFLRLGMATTVLSGVQLLVAGQVDLLTVLVFFIAASRLYDPLSFALQNLAATFHAKLQIERMRAIEQQPVQTGSSTCNPNQYDIVFDHVSFAYHKDEGVLQDVSFTAKQGQVTALVGPSGGGKSTAAKLAARFWDVNAGRIMLGGINLASVEPEALLRHYAVVFQDVVLFHASVLDNIRIGRQSATNEEVLAAARAAQCDSFISALPQGYHTVLGENGSTLSGGERQRISIARALLKDAPVILLDEATASLDVENETAVQLALSRLIQQKTVLVIAHRMRTVATADHIVVLEEGKVCQQGNPAELLAQPGPYQHMVQLQQQSESWAI